MMPPMEIESAPPLTLRLLGQGPDWRVSDVVCRAGPSDRRFEERHEDYGIGLVVGGTFGYRAASGRALLHPGAVLLGNAGTCYECGHEHGHGDRCIAVQLAPALFEEIAAFAAGTARFRFATPMLPSGPALARILVALEAASTGTAASMEELALAVAEQVVAASAGATLRCEPCPAADERRVARAIRLVEARAEEALGLDALAAEAGMSRYHFLRRFRRVTGRTPYRYLLDLRLRRAALRLRRTRESVATIAFDIGFGDLSTFNAQFRAAFGQAPQAWRRSGVISAAVPRRVVRTPSGRAIADMTHPRHPA